MVAPPIPFRRIIRRPELQQWVPLADTTIYEMERRGEFPRRFNLTPRCVVWDLAEVATWLAARRQAPDADALKRAPHQMGGNASGGPSNKRPQRRYRQRPREQRGRIPNVAEYAAPTSSAGLATFSPRRIAKT